MSSCQMPKCKHGRSVKFKFAPACVMSSAEFKTQFLKIIKRSRKRSISNNFFQTLLLGCAITIWKFQSLRQFYTFIRLYLSVKDDFPITQFLNILQKLRKRGTSNNFIQTLLFGYAIALWKFAINISTFTRVRYFYTIIFENKGRFSNNKIFKNSQKIEKTRYFK